MADTDPGAQQDDSLRAVGRSAAILFVGLLVSQAFIAAREIWVASQVGASLGFDTLVVGIGLPIGVSLVLASGASVALVPGYLEALAAGDRERARRYAGAVVTWIVVGSAIMVLLLEVFADGIVAIMGAGLSADAQAQAAGFLRIASLGLLFSAPLAVLRGVCQAEKAFVVIAVATGTVSAAELSFVFLLWDTLGLTGYAISVVIGPLTGVAVLLIGMAPRSILPLPNARVRGMGFRRFAGHAVPLTVSQAILQANIVVDLSVASRLGEGSISALRYGQMLVNVPGGAIAAAWGNAIYPTLVGTRLGAGGSRLASVTERGLRFVAVAFVPIAWLTAAVAPLAVAVVFGRGAFTTEGIEATAAVVVGLAPMLLLTMFQPVHVGALNAHRKGVILLFGGILNVFLNTVFDIVLGFTLGVFGIALSTSLTLAIVLVFFSWRLSKLEQGIGWGAIMRTVLVASAAAIPVAAVAGWYAWQNWEDVGTAVGLAALVIIGAGGMSAYLAIATGLRIPEARVIAGEALRLLSRNRFGSDRDSKGLV